MLKRGWHDGTMHSWWRRSLHWLSIKRQNSQAKRRLCPTIQCGFAAFCVSRYSKLKCLHFAWDRRKIERIFGSRWSRTAPQDIQLLLKNRLFSWDSAVEAEQRLVVTRRISRRIRNFIFTIKQLQRNDRKKFSMRQNKSFEFFSFCWKAKDGTQCSPSV